jgi:hypothetical protein
MKRSFNIFIGKLVAFTVIIAAILYILSLFIPARYFSPALPYLILFFLVFTILVHYILMKASGNNGRKFVNGFMMATLLKFFVYIPLIIAYVWTNKDDLIPFVIGFFALYLAYTVFEVVAIVKYSNKPVS